MKLNNTRWRRTGRFRVPNCHNLSFTLINKKKQKITTGEKLGTCSLHTLNLPTIIIWCLYYTASPDCLLVKPLIRSASRTSKNTCANNDRIQGATTSQKRTNRSLLLNCRQSNCTGKRGPQVRCDLNSGVPPRRWQRPLSGQFSDHLLLQL